MKNKCKLIGFLYENKLHLALLIFGSIIHIVGCFQNSLWFDEAYSVGLVQHDLVGLVKWSIGDVHPPLYYIMLKLFTLLFGNNLYVMRVFSTIGTILFAGLGLFHIKKDFGPKVGFWYTFCVLMTSSTLLYSLQIRMYTWAALFVTLTAIYAFRVFRGSQSKSDRILFLVCSITSAYIHYFALFAVGIINLVLLCSCIKGEKDKLRRWFIDGAIQIGSYIPGALIFIYQISLGGAGWIRMEWPDMIFDLVSYHMLGDVLKVYFGNDNGQYNYPYTLTGGIFLLLYVLAGWLLYRAIKRNKSDSEFIAAKCAAITYYSLILFTFTVSLFRAVYYIRYTVVVCGLLFFMIAVLISSFKKRFLKILAALVMVVIFTFQTVNYFDVLFDPSADDISETLDSRVQEEDTFLFDSANSYVVSVHYPHNPAYFYNYDNWGVHHAYRAFGTKSYVLDTLDCQEVYEFGDRVWTIDRGMCYNKLIELGYVEAEAHHIHLRYHDIYYETILMIKDN